MTSAAAILASNAPRAATLRASWDAYDPLRGVGSPLPRVEVRWNDDKSFWLPVAMLDDPEIGAGLRWCVETGATLKDLRESNPSLDALTEEDEWAYFCRVRIRYDYEYWCATCASVEDKRTKSLIPLVLTPPQRASMAQRERMRASGRPVRQIELKHRQYGSSTEKNAYLFWMQNVVTDGRHAWLLSLSNGGAAEIARRYELIVSSYPEWAGSVTSAGVRNAPNTQRISVNGGAGSILGIGSSNNPQGPSGYTAHLVLISEAGKMGSTDVQSAERLITNVTSTVPRDANTCILVESTAEASGRWFREEVMEARKGDAGTSAYAFHFTTWTTDPTCWTDLSRAECVRRAGSTERWVETLSDYHRALFVDHGATLEQVAWYIDSEAEKPEPWMMQQENPTTPDEAFQYGERRRFHPAHLAVHRKTCTEPVRGRLVADTLTGRSALVGIQFVPDPRGDLRVWRFPTDCYDFIKSPQTHRYTNPGVAAMDIGGTWEKADFTDIPLLDRRPMAHGAPPEIAAEWHGHLDQDLAAWAAVQLCQWYGQAWGPITLAVEVNSLREDQGDPADGLEPDHSLTVLDAISGVYPYLYRRRVMDRTTQTLTDKLGWHTNRQSKGRAVDLLHRALREGYEDGGGYIEREAEAVAEMEGYLLLDNGAMQAAPGMKDDRVMTRAILMAVSDEMGACRVFPRTAAADDLAAVGRVGRGLI